jgi:uncharacterized protein
MKIISRTFAGCVAALLLALPPLSQCAQTPALSIDQAFEKLKTYDDGQDNTALVVLEQFVGRMSNDAVQRQQTAGRLADILAEERTSAAAKLFTCQQLRLIGGAPQVPLLVKMLEKPATADLARLVLQSMPGEAAGKALLGALTQTRGDALVGVINSLGARREAAAVAPLSKLLGEPEANIAVAAALALANIGNQEAADALATAKPAAAFAPKLLEAQLLCAQRLVENGSPVRAEAVYRKLEASNPPLNVRMAVLAGLVKASPQAALPSLLAALQFGAPQLQGLAADLARHLPGPAVTSALAQQAAKLEGPPCILLLGALAERGDAAALADLGKLASNTALRADATRELRRLRSATRELATQELLEGVIKDAGAAVTTLSPTPYSDDVIARRRQQITASLAADDALVCYLDCGVEGRAQGASGISLRQVNGAAWQYPGSEQAAALPFGTVAHNGSSLEFELAGLDPRKRYALGFSWWDFDSNGRAQSVSLVGSGGKRVPALASTKLPGYTAGRKLPAIGSLPIDSSLINQGKLRVAFAHQSGPNAVVSELWLIDTRPGSLAATKVALDGATVAAPASPKPVDLDPPAQGTRVLLVTGIDYPGHPWQQTAPALKTLLEADPRLKVRIVEDPNAALASPKLKDWDVVIIHFMNWEVPGPGPQARENLSQFVAGGKGMMLTHFACGAWGTNEWPEFKKLAGRVYDPKLRPHDPHGKFRVDIADPTHPITKGLEPFETVDELYTCLGPGDAPIRVVATAKSKVDGKDYPMGFVLDYGQGRVFHTVLGHDARAYTNNPAVGELMRRACAWAAGLPPVK